MTVAPVSPVSSVRFHTSINFGRFGQPSKSVNCNNAGPLLSATFGSSYAINVCMNELNSLKQNQIPYHNNL